MQASEIIARDFTTGRPLRGRKQRVVVSSSKCSWHNLFKVERYIRPSFELSQVTFLETSVSFLTEQTEPHSLAEWRLAGRPIPSRPARAGSVFTLAKDTPISSRYIGRIGVTVVSFSDELL